MKQACFIPLCIFIAFSLKAQSVAINNDGSMPDVNAALDVKSNTKGILIPRMDSVARKTIPNTKGLYVYDNSTNSFWYNDGTAWQNVIAQKNKIIFEENDHVSNTDSLVIINLDGTNKKIIPVSLPSGWNLEEFRITPDGNTIVLSMWSGMIPGIATFRIYTCSIDGSNLKIIYQPPQERYLTLGSPY